MKIVARVGRRPGPSAARPRPQAERQQGGRPLK